MPVPVPADGAGVAGCPSAGTGTVGDVGVVGATGSGGRPSFARSRSTRAWSAASARVMNACQMIAGNVPPSTGPPWNSVFMGLKPCG